MVQPIKTPSPSDDPRGPDGAPEGGCITLIDQGTQADFAAGETMGAEGVSYEDMGEDTRSVTSPETPSVVCHSSLDVTASSLTEVNVSLGCAFGVVWA